MRINSIGGFNSFLNNKVPFRAFETNVTDKGAMRQIIEEDIARGAIIPWKGVSVEDVVNGGWERYSAIKRLSEDSKTINGSFYIHAGRPGVEQGDRETWRSSSYEYSLTVNGSGGLSGNGSAFALHNTENIAKLEKLAAQDKGSSD